MQDGIPIGLKSSDGQELCLGDCINWNGKLFNILWDSWNLQVMFVEVDDKSPNELRHYLGRLEGKVYRLGSMQIKP